MRSLARGAWLTVGLLCASTVCAYAADGFALEQGVDRPGSDYTSSALAPGESVEQCAAACRAQPQCKAFTFVRANTIQGPNPRCWLKTRVPPPRPDSCCISDVKEADTPAGQQQKPATQE